MRSFPKQFSITRRMRLAIAALALPAMACSGALQAQEREESRETFEPGTASGQVYSGITPVRPTIHADPIPPTLEAQQTIIGPGVTPIEEIQTREAIRDNWANYSLLIDGDGTALREHEWANLTFTEDFRWLWYDSQGRTTGEVGRDAMQRLPIPNVTQRPWKHLPIATKFDEINQTTARTRTIMLMLGIQKATRPNQPDGAPGLSSPGVPMTAMAVYHDTWRKENGYWLKSSTIVYSANCGFFPFPEPGDYNCVDEAVLYTPPLDMSGGSEEEE